MLLISRVSVAMDGHSQAPMDGFMASSEMGSMYPG